MSNLTSQRKVCGIVHGKPLDTLENCLDEMELALVTVRDVIARNADGASFEDSYIGVNLGLYVAHAEDIIKKCRLLDQSVLTSVKWPERKGAR